MSDCYLITEAGPNLLQLTIYQSPSLLTIDNLLGELGYWLSFKGEQTGLLVDVSTSQSVHTPLGYVRYARFLQHHPELRVGIYGGGRVAEQQIAIINQMGRSAHQVQMFPDQSRALSWLLATRQSESSNSHLSER